MFVGFGQSFYVDRINVIYNVVIIRLGVEVVFDDFIMSVINDDCCIIWDGVQMIFIEFGDDIYFILFFGDNSGVDIIVLNGII